MALRMPSAATSSAWGQDCSVMSPPTRTRGSRIRSGACTYSKPNRPLSQSQPWFTGSTSTPRKRTSRFDDDCTAPRHPTEQDWQVVSLV